MPIFISISYAHISACLLCTCFRGPHLCRWPSGISFSDSPHQICSRFRFSLKTEYFLILARWGRGRGLSRGRRPSGPLFSFSARRVRSPYQFSLETEHIRYPSPRRSRICDVILGFGRTCAECIHFHYFRSFFVALTKSYVFPAWNIKTITYKVKPKSSNSREVHFMF